MVNTSFVKAFINSPSIIIVTLIFSALYFTYLALIAQMIIFHDSIGYEFLGKMIAEKGLKTFLVSGPHREPVYPLLIAASMKLGSAWNLSYQDVLKFLQIIILLLTQVLAWRICKILKLSNLTTAMVILYFVFSPKIVNSALICYSEIATYPWLLAIILASAHCWMSVKNQQKKALMVWSIVLGLSLTGATLTKGVFLLVFPGLMLPVVYSGLVTLKDKKPEPLKLILIFLVAVSVSYQIPIHLYKLANKKFNGQLTISDNRGSWALYGNSAKRVEPKKEHKLQAAIVYAVGSEICNKFFTLDECLYWSASRSDYLGINKLFELEKENLSQEKINKKLISLSIQEIFKDPLQYTLFYGIELIKVFFWDFRDIAYVVAFPTVIENIYNYPPFHYTFYFLIALLTFTSFVYLTNVLRKNLISFSHLACDLKTFLLYQLFLVILFYNLAYALFFIDPRHILPLGPLYILTIAWMMENLFLKKTTIP